MAYTPINLNAFTAAYSGAISGMAVSGWITSASAANYLLVTQIAGAFAQAFDQAWNDAATLNTLEQQNIVTACQNEFAGRGPGPLADPRFQLASQWTVPAAACAALVLEGDAYFLSQGITPPSPPGPPPPQVFISRNGTNGIGEGVVLDNVGLGPIVAELPGIGTTNLMVGTCFYTVAGDLSANTAGTLAVSPTIDFQDGGGEIAEVTYSYAIPAASGFYTVSGMFNFGILLNSQGTGAIVRIRASYTTNAIMSALNTSTLIFDLTQPS